MTGAEKTCTECAEAKPLECFYKRSKSSDGHGTKCIECVKVYKKAYYAKNAESIKAGVRAYYQENREERRERGREYYAMHADERREYGRAYYAANWDACNAQNKAWRESNPERERERHAEYRAKHSVERAAYSARWRVENPEKMAACRRAWKVANPDKVLESARITGARRRALKAEATMLAFTAEELRQRWAYYGNKCWICRGEATQTDHVKPIAKGGAHMLCNLRPCCATCNQRKNDQWPFDPQAFQVAA